MTPQAGLTKIKKAWLLGWHMRKKSALCLSSESFLQPHQTPLWNIFIKTKVFSSHYYWNSFGEAVNIQCDQESHSLHWQCCTSSLSLAYGSWQKRRGRVCQRQCSWDTSVHLHIWIHSNWDSMHKICTGLRLIKFHRWERRWTWSLTP